MTDDIPATPPPAILLGEPEILEILGIGRSLWRTLLSAGQTPEPIRLGRRVLWRRTDIEAWIAAGCPSREKMAPSTPATATSGPQGRPWTKVVK